MLNDIRALLNAGAAEVNVGGRLASELAADGSLKNDEDALNNGEATGDESSEVKRSKKFKAMLTAKRSQSIIFASLVSLGALATNDRVLAFVTNLLNDWNGEWKKTQGCNFQLRCSSSRIGTELERDTSSGRQSTLQIWFKGIDAGSERRRVFVWSSAASLKIALTKSNY